MCSSRTPGQQGHAISTQPTLYRAAPDDVVLRDLDGLEVVYHRPSGLTHIVTAPVPEILGVMADQAAVSAADVLARLGATFDLADGSAEVIAARLEEMTALGLVRRA